MVADAAEPPRDFPPIDPAVSPISTVYMLRTVQQHHVQLSVMADVKASILITAASILITAFVALTSSLGIEPGIVAAVPFILASLGFAIYAVLPKGGGRDGPKPGTPGFNLFFFGHFGSLTEDEFTYAMMETIADTRTVYLNQIKDIYQLGQYLSASKYRYLRLSYFALFLGVVVGVITELVAVVV